MKRGFTLLELMIVMAIVSILVGLSVFASFRVYDVAKAAATRTTIAKVDEAVRIRIHGINEWNAQSYNRLITSWLRDPYKRERDRQLGLRFVGRLGWPMDVFQAMPRIEDGEGFYRALSLRDRVLDTFPVTHDELVRCSWVLDDVTEVDRHGEVFLYALCNAPVYGALPMIVDDFESSELTDPDHDGVMELADGWGNPIRFYRSPTRLVQDEEARTVLMPNAPDQSSEYGILHVKPLDKPTVNLVEFYHDKDTWTAPLTVSSGPDGELGLDEPDTDYPVTILGKVIHRFGLAGVLDVSDTYDNITSSNL